MSSDLPVFTIRRKLLSWRWYIYVTFPGGEKRKVARFRSAREAQEWVQLRGPGWLSRHRKEWDQTGLPAPALGARPSPA